MFPEKEVKYIPPPEPPDLDKQLLSRMESHKDIDPLVEDIRDADTLTMENSSKVDVSRFMECNGRLSIDGKVRKGIMDTGGFNGHESRILWI